MKLTPGEVEVLKAGRTACVLLPRVAGAEPTARAGRTYRVRGLGEVTVLRVRAVALNDMKLGDVKRTGHRDYGALAAWWRLVVGEGEKAWELRLVRGDRTDRARLMAPTGRKSGDYTSDPSRAMRGEPEAMSEADVRYYTGIAHAARAEEIRAFRRRVTEEARVVAGGSRKTRRQLRNLERVLSSLTGTD